MPDIMMIDQYMTLRTNRQVWIHKSTLYQEKHSHNYRYPYLDKALFKFLQHLSRSTIQSWYDITLKVDLKNNPILKDFNGSCFGMISTRLVIIINNS